MCRIAGIISQKFTAAELQLKAASMCQALAHGGPDDEGIHLEPEIGLALCHRRLSIIDLSARGHQPMADAGQRVYLSFNGEIYNYLNLKAELIQLSVTFKTDTDTEVIIQSYLQWGTASFAKLRGMFAFALYDKQEQKTLLVRDSSGIKPLYYFADKSELYFASETKAFTAAALVTETDANWPIRFLAFGHVQEPYTTLKDVFSLPKSSYLEWNHHNALWSIQRFETDNITKQHIPREASTDLRTTLDGAIKRQLIADAPIGVFLSGGTDSSLITAQAAKHTREGQLKTVSIYFDEAEYTERQYQEEVLKHTKAEQHFHLVTQQDFEEALPTILNDMDIPTTDGVNSWFISKYARQSGLKAVLSGIGADELFGGYPSFRRIKFLRYRNLLVGAPLRMLSKLLPMRQLKRLEYLSYKHPLAEYLFLRGLFAPTEVAKLLNISRQKVTDILFADKVQPDTSDYRLKAAWYETNLYMQNQLLRDADVMSMAHGLEVRVPFLDEDVRYLVDTIPPDTRFDKKQPKGFLINTYLDVLPNKVWNRRKMGFSFPLQQWMRQHKEIVDTDLYENEAARKLISDFAAGKEHWSRAFTVYQLQRQQALKASNKKVLLLTLVAFSNTGGIQKMCRTMAYAMQKIASRNRWDYSLWSGYDNASQLGKGYTNPENFKGFKKKRHVFVWDAVRKGIKCDVVILTHINMALIGWLIKKRNPNVKVWLICHGIEVWRPLRAFKRKVLSVCDKVICVSEHTKQKMADMHGVKPEQLGVLNNAIDPFFKPPAKLIKPSYLLQRYGLSKDCQVIFTLTRLASTEQYKGYEQVIKAVGRLKLAFPNIRYVLSGKYDEVEEARIRDLIAEQQVEKQVLITGFIDETELEDHFLLADVFVLPSKKEGFGIVFIEAMACGLPVICGNADGSVDAIKNGELGTAVDTDNLDELTAAITQHLKNPLPLETRYDLQSKCVGYFNANVYADKLEQMLLQD